MTGFVLWAWASSLALALTTAAATAAPAVVKRGEPCRLSLEPKEQVNCAAGLSCHPARGFFGPGVCQDLAHGSTAGQECRLSLTPSEQINCQAGLLCKVGDGQLFGRGVCQDLGTKLADVGVARPAAGEGQVCRLSLEIREQINCAAGLICRAESGFFGPGVCHDLAHGSAVGEQCSLSTTPSEQVNCRAGLVCKTDSGLLGRGVCKEAGVRLTESLSLASDPADTPEAVGEGEACRLSFSPQEQVNCGTGLICRPESGFFGPGYCVDSTHGAPVGEECGLSLTPSEQQSCETGLVCKTDEGGLFGRGHCVELGDALPDPSRIIGGGQDGGEGGGLFGGNNPFGGGNNPFSGGNNPFSGGNNPFSGGNNPLSGNGGNGLFGGGNPFRPSSSLVSVPFVGKGQTCRLALDIQEQINCEAGLVCRPDSGFMGRGVCKDLSQGASVGEACHLSTTPSEQVNCKVPLMCKTQHGLLGEGVCQEAGATSAVALYTTELGVPVVGKGQDCRLSLEINEQVNCLSGLVCRPESGFFGPGVCRDLSEGAQAGQPCSLSVMPSEQVNCESGLICKVRSGLLGSGICQEIAAHSHASLATAPTAGKDERCKLSFDPNEQINCDTGLICRPESGFFGEGTCKDLADGGSAGDECNLSLIPSEQVNCKAGLVCKTEGLFGRGVCEEIGGSITTSSPPPTSEKGEPCFLSFKIAEQVNCKAGLICKASSGLMGAGECEDPTEDTGAEEGQECVLSLRPSEQVNCKVGLVCKTDGGFLGRGVCESIGGKSAGEGDRCRMTANVTRQINCAAGLVCITESNGLGDGLCQRPDVSLPPSVEEGEVCNLTVSIQHQVNCKAGLICVTPEARLGEGVCQQLGSRDSNLPSSVGQGERCNLTIVPRYQINCEAGLICHPDSGLMGQGECQEIGADGAGSVSPRPAAPVGGACNFTLWPQYQVNCEVGLVCVTQHGGLGPGLCHNLTATNGPAEEDQMCRLTGQADEIVECVAGLMCHTSSAGGFGATGVCKPVANVDSNPQAKEGESCRLLGPIDELVYCEMGLACFDTSGYMSLRGTCHSLSWSRSRLAAVAAAAAPPRLRGAGHA